MKFLWRPALAILVATIVALPAVAQNGKETVQRLAEIFSAWSGGPLSRNVSDEAARHIDYAGMAEAAVGSSEWDKLNPRKKAEFVGTFRRLVEHRYYRRWHRLFRKGKLTVISEVSVKGDTMVKSSLKVGKKVDTVIWRLHPKNGQLTVVSLAVGERDLLTRLRARFQKYMAKNGINGVVAWMKDKLDEDEGPDPVGEASLAPTGR